MFLKTSSYFGRHSCVPTFASFTPVAALPSTFFALALLGTNIHPALAAQSQAAQPSKPSETALADVVVTASRFPDQAANTPASLSVITGAEVRAQPSVSLPDLLRQRAGVEVRNLYGMLGRDSAVDIRGFGSSAGSNVLVLVDGVRLSAVDSSGLEWASISRESIDRIEILRGPSTVLYGDRASGGVINVITNRSKEARFSAQAGIGSFGYGAFGISAAGKGNSGLYGNLNLSQEEERGYRINSQADQRALSTRAGWQNKKWDVYADVSAWERSNGSPGALFNTQYQDNPRFSRSPLAYTNGSGYRLRPGVRGELNDQLQLEVEAQHEQKSSAFFSNPSSVPFRLETQSENFTPRLKWGHGLLGLKSDTIFGLDVYRGHARSNSSGSRNEAIQDSNSWYVQNTTSLGGGVSSQLGYRTQRMAQSAGDFSKNVTGNTVRTREAAEAGLQWKINPAWRVFARAATTYRFANTDELFAFDVNFNPVFSGGLLPQHGSQTEAGTEWVAGPHRVQVSVYKMRLYDEILYDGSRNLNLPNPTQRNGFELEASTRIARQWQVQSAFKYMTARIDGGQYDGKAVPLVPHASANISLRWLGGEYGSHGINARYASSRRVANDFDNSKKPLPAYGVFDWQSSYTWQKWTASLTIRNLLNKKYTEFGGYDSFNKDYYYYPTNPRGVYLTVRYDF